MEEFDYNVSDENENQRLDVFLARTIEGVPSRVFVQKLITEGLVTVNGKRIKSNHRLVMGDSIHVNYDESIGEPTNAVAENIPLDIFYEDENLIVVNKPSGMLVHPARGRHSGTLVNALLHYTKHLSDYNTAIRPGIVHRLDEDTSGLILIAKDNKTHNNLSEQFQKHLVGKKYVALVEGKVEFDEGKIDDPIGRHPRDREKKAVQYDDKAKDAVTLYKTIARVPGLTFVALFPQTGRTHQLRVHMAHLGHPILGDPKYGKRQSFDRLALHAQAIEFTHPRTKAIMQFSTPLPGEFLAKVKAVEKKS